MVAAIIAGLPYSIPSSAKEPAELPIDQILVSSVRDTNVPPVTETHNFLRPDEVDKIDAASAAAILSRLPSIHVPTNSRGESIVFMRNAGERQVVVFLGGAMLNVPWDNRFDLSMLPGHLVGSVLSASGPLSARYGVNALGAVNLLLPDDKSGAELIAERGEHGVRRYEGMASGSVGPLEILGATSYSAQNAEPVAPHTQPLLYQASRSARTNTDRELLSFAGRAGIDIEKGRIDGTFIYSDGRKGVAPEGHLVSGARFWRYPQHRLVQSNLHADLDFTDSINLTVSAWAQDFSQDIDQYPDATYAFARDREEDKDRTYGSRGVVTTRISPNSRVALSYNLLSSTHDQRDIRIGASPAAPWLKYRQRAISAGADLEHHFSDRLAGEVGAGVDWLAYTRTGDKPSIPSFVEPTAHGGLAYSITEQWRVRIGAGYKTRSPTMRDLFGVALNLFLLNPNLTAERVLILEAASEWHAADVSVSATPFVQLVDNTIDQRNVGTLRQRVNLRGSRVLGLEISSRVRLSEEWQVAGDVTASLARRRRANLAESVYLSEKPAVLARLSVDYAGTSGFDASIELDHTGRAYSADAVGDLRPLEVSTQINGKLALNLERIFPGFPASQIYLRADNFLNTSVEPQLGLPGPGRWVRGGVRVSW
jgi:iron complex outermembrane receptor protein